MRRGVTLIVAGFGLLLATTAKAEDTVPYDRVLTRIYDAQEFDGGVMRLKGNLEREYAKRPLPATLYGIGLCASLISSEIRSSEGRSVTQRLEAAIEKWPRSARLRTAYAQCLIRFDHLFHAPVQGDTWAQITRSPDGTRRVRILDTSPMGLAKANELTAQARILAPKDPSVYMFSGAIERDPKRVYAFLSRSVELGGMEISGYSLAIMLHRNAERREDEAVLRKYGDWIKRYAAAHPNSRRIAELRERGYFPD